MNGRKARESGLSDMLHPSRVLLWPSGAVCGGAGGVGRGPEARPQFLDRAQAPNPAVHGGFRAPAGRLAKSGRGGMMRQLAAMRARPRGKKPRTRRLRYAEQSPAFRSIGVVPRQSRAHCVGGLCRVDCSISVTRKVTVPIGLGALFVGGVARRRRPSEEFGAFTLCLPTRRSTLRRRPPSA
jgi:hypothetical protein